MKGAMVQFKDVKKHYTDNISALNGVTFQVEPGEFTFIVGPSGAGKSTLIRLLIRQERPTEGDIVFDDISVPQIPRDLLSVYRQQIGIVFQDLKLIENKTVRENIDFALEITGRDDADINITSEYLLDVVNLEKRQHLFPSELSGGERQRVAIARALANDPKLFIADEPTGNLDPDTAQEIVEILKTINGWGTTVLVVTHDQKIVDDLQTRVIHMKDGKIISDEKGGYFDTKGAQHPESEDLSEKLKKAMDEEKRTERDKEIHTSLKSLGLGGKVLKKLEKAGITDLEDLLDTKVKELEEIGLTENQINDLDKLLEDQSNE